MNTAQIRLIKACTVAAVVLCLFVIASAQITDAQQSTASGEWKDVEAVFGFPPASLPGGVVRFNMPRKDLHVTVAGIEVKPGLALGAWAAFYRVGPNDAMIMGDLVVTSDEVAPVMKALQDGGVEITALHNHLVGESPQILYIHMGGHGDPVAMARTVKRAIGLTKTPLPQGGSTKESTDIGFDVAVVEKIMGHQGNVSGGGYCTSMCRAQRSLLKREW